MKPVGRINLLRGDIFASTCEALVNPVNTVGRMGKGLALAFSLRFPEILRPYREACRSGALRVGTVLFFERDDHPRFVVQFPTKEHWKDPSRMEYIVQGLEALGREVAARGVKSIAFPALGCGLGGLPWSGADGVRAKLIQWGEFRDLDIEIYHDDWRKDA